MSSSIEIASYNHNWPNLFRNQEIIIKKALGDNFIIAHHIGSTSVPNLAAKNKIDIIAVVDDLLFDNKKLSIINYNYRGSFNIPFHKVFTYRSQDVNVNLHIYEKDDSQIKLNLLFRDYLRCNSNYKDEYAKLKYKLIAEQSSHHKNNSIYTGYTLGKDVFINKIISKTGFDKFRFVFAVHQKEREMLSLLNNISLEKLESDRYTYFFLYKGVDIIGGASIDILENKIENIVLCNDYKCKEVEEYFTKLCKKWLHSRLLF